MLKGTKNMAYLDEEILESKRRMEHEKYTTLETGIYAGEELITFKKASLFNELIHIHLPEQFVLMPDLIKAVKYPSQNAPELIMTSLDSTVNIGFNLMPLVLKDNEIALMSEQFQNGLKNVNPSIVIKNRSDTKTIQGNEMSWFAYKGFHLDGQSYNRVYLIRLRKNILHGIFNCNLQEQENWIQIIEQIFLSVEEEL